MKRKPRTRRQLEAAAAKATQSEQKAFGPLFAHLAPVTTATDVYWRHRRNAALAAENIGHIAAAAEALHLLRLAKIEREAVRWIAPEIVGKLIAYSRSVYTSCVYWLDFWRQVLTGAKTVVFSWQTVAGRVVPLDTWPQVDWVPLSREEFLSIFPPAFEFFRSDPTDDDPNGLFSLVADLKRG